MRVAFLVGALVTFTCCPCVGMVVFAIVVSQNHANFASACFGRPVPEAAARTTGPGLHKVVVLTRQAPTYVPDYNALPDGWVSFSRGEAELALCLEDATPVVIERCANGRVRVVLEQPARLYEARTPTLIAEATLRSPVPVPCDVRADGEPSTEAAIEVFLRPYVVVP